MKSLFDIASVLRSQAASIGITQEVLRERAGISRRTLTHVLGGQQDFKMTTLLAVADKLGLELVLVPKAAAAGLAYDAASAPVPLSAIEVAQAQVAARVAARAKPFRKSRT